MDNRSFADSLGLWALAGVAAGCLLLVGCGQEASGARERAIAPSTVSNAELSWPSRLPSGRTLAPNEAEVRNALRRVFGSEVELQDPIEFVAGDFNGDESEDLAAIVHPLQDKLPDLNNTLANWTIQNPRRAYIAPHGHSVVTPPPIPSRQVIRRGDVLVAVLHGYGPGGWRDPASRQAYLLRESAGTKLKAKEPSPSLLHDFGTFPSRRDVISEQLGEMQGVIYWTGATYAWHTEDKK